MCLAMNADQLGEGKHCASTLTEILKGARIWWPHASSQSGHGSRGGNYGHFVDVRKLA